MEVSTHGLQPFIATKEYPISKLKKLIKILLTLRDTVANIFQNL